MGIGTLGERNLHATLKRYCEPNESLHEVKVDRYVADVLRGNEILEIQTRQFYKLIPKLNYFLLDKRVCVIHPITYEKTLIWIDPATGEYSKPRKSPKRGVVQELFYELYALRELLNHSGLSFRVILVNVEEYRTLDGWSRDRKKGSHRAERIPTEIVADYRFANREDWSTLLPSDLLSPFTVKEFARKCGISPLCASRGCVCLKQLGVIRQCGKKGNAYLYERVTD